MRLISEMRSCKFVLLLACSFICAPAAILRRRKSTYLSPINLPSSSAISNDNLETIYDRFVSSYLVQGSPSSPARIKWGSGPRSVFKSRTPNGRASSSEGMGLGMLITAYAKDKAIFNALFRGYDFARGKNQSKLMPWLVWGDFSAVDTEICNEKCHHPGGQYPLPHADIDAAMALLVASAQWGNKGDINYRREAVHIINTLSTSWLKNCKVKGMWVIQHGHSDNFDPCSSEISPWYYKPAFFRYFASIEGVKHQKRWLSLAESSYEIFNMKKVLSKTFVPDRIRLNDATLVPAADFSYACTRIPWHVALDYALHDSPRAKRFATRLISDLVFRSNNGTIDGITGPINRTTGNSEIGNPRSFQGGFASAAAIAFNQSTSEYFASAFVKTALNDQYKWNLGNGFQDAHNDAYGMAMSTLSALFITGNFKHPTVLAAERNDLGDEICATPQKYGFLLSSVQLENSHSIAEMLRKHSEGNSAGKQLSILTKHFEKIDGEIQMMNQREINRRDCETPRTLLTARKFLQYYGWGKMENKSCVTEFRMSKRSFHLKHLFNAMFSLTKLLNDPNFKQPLYGYFQKDKQVFATGLYRYKNQYRRCDLAATTGYRLKGGRWVIWRSFTNAHPSEPMGVEKRLILSEGLHVQNNTIQSQELSLPVCVKNHLLRMTNGTTIRSESDGKDDWSEFRNAEVVENGAVIAALEDGEQEMQLAIDSNTWSNTAILVLPIFLAAVPLALFADVSGKIAIAYAIVTDIVSVLPLLIKGIEMLIFGSRETYAARALVYGALTKSDLGVTESWVAKCRIKDNVSRNGALLVAVAVLGMVLGISIELLARRQMEKNKVRERRARDLESEDNLTSQFRGRRDVLSEQREPMIRGLLWDMVRRRATEEERRYRDKLGQN